jgi:hypothetical protein
VHQSSNNINEGSFKIEDQRILSVSGQKLDHEVISGNIDYVTHNRNSVVYIPNNNKISGNPHQDIIMRNVMRNMEKKNEMASRSGVKNNFIKNVDRLSNRNSSKSRERSQKKERERSHSRRSNGEARSHRSSSKKRADKRERVSAKERLSAQS